MIFQFGKVLGLHISSLLFNYNFALFFSNPGWLECLVGILNCKMFVVNTFWSVCTQTWCSVSHLCLHLLIVISITITYILLFIWKLIEFNFYWYVNLDTWNKWNIKLKIHHYDAFSLSYLLSSGASFLLSSTSNPLEGSSIFHCYQRENR